MVYNHSVTNRREAIVYRLISIMIVVGTLVYIGNSMVSGMTKLVDDRQQTIEQMIGE